MDDRERTPDWALMRAFLAVGEEGSLTAAAQSLGASQPTLGRQIRELEAQLGAELFHRQPRGLVLSELGQSLLGPARAMRDAAQQITLRAAGQQQKLAGTVRVASSIAVATYHLPEILAALRIKEPQIAIELVPSDDSSNLLYREADIAIRMYRPTQLDLITQYLGEVRLAAFAARSYLARHGTPRSVADLQDHDFVGFDQSTEIIDGLIAAGLPATRDWFGMRCDNQIVYWQMVRAGCGIGFSQASIGQHDADMVEILHDISLPKLPVWLTAHEAMRQTPRIRRVWQALAEGLAPICQ
ncbi:MAG: LysR family transcriptional regulator [Rhodobacteraceae bacterium]|nr:LysR family transcriptional regulator [Paracoccaceae bacterium]